MSRDDVFRNISGVRPFVIKFFKTHDSISPLLRVAVLNFSFLNIIHHHVLKIISKNISDKRGEFFIFENELPVFNSSPKLVLRKAFSDVIFIKFYTGCPG